MPSALTLMKVVAYAATAGSGGLISAVGRGGRGGSPHLVSGSVSCHCRFGGAHDCRMGWRGRGEREEAKQRHIHRFMSAATARHERTAEMCSVASVTIRRRAISPRGATSPLREGRCSHATIASAPAEVRTVISSPHAAATQMPLEAILETCAWEDRVICCFLVTINERIERHLQIKIQPIGAREQETLHAHGCHGTTDSNPVHNRLSSPNPQGRRPSPYLGPHFLRAHTPPLGAHLFRVLLSHSARYFRRGEEQQEGEEEGAE